MGGGSIQTMTPSMRKILMREGEWSDGGGESVVCSDVLVQPAVVKALAFLEHLASGFCVLGGRDGLLGGGENDGDVVPTGIKVWVAEGGRGDGDGQAAGRAALVQAWHLIVLVFERTELMRSDSP